jgi:U3 small nucleolar RNA-associated protein 6
MLAELKDLGEKGLFSASEIKHIIKKRTAFETALVRRIPNKNDYLRYAAYEMGLEALRRKRVARLSASSLSRLLKKRNIQTGRSTPENKK